jgi:YHS domain-containing protein
MKKTLALILAVSVVSAAFAGPAKPPAPKPMHCAVMTEDTVNIATATKNKQFADYKGRRYYFCCEMCIGKFKANPEKYAKNPSVPIPTTPKGK